jgi:predicted nucleic acid-binding Zn ribbon protein
MQDTPLKAVQSSSTDLTMRTPSNSPCKIQQQNSSSHSPSSSQTSSSVCYSDVQSLTSPSSPRYEPVEWSHEIGLSSQSLIQQSTLDDSSMAFVNEKTTGEVQEIQSASPQLLIHHSTLRDTSMDSDNEKGIDEIQLILSKECICGEAIPHDSSHVCSKCCDEILITESPAKSNNGSTECICPNGWKECIFEGDNLRDCIYDCSKCDFESLL